LEVTLEIRIGATLPQQHSTYDELRAGWAMAEELGIDVLYN